MAALHEAPEILGRGGAGIGEERAELGGDGLGALVLDHELGVVGEELPERGIAAEHGAARGERLQHRLVHAVRLAHVEREGRRGVQAGQPVHGHGAEELDGQVPGGHVAPERGLVGGVVTGQGGTDDPQREPVAAQVRHHRHQEIEPLAPGDAAHREQVRARRRGRAQREQLRVHALADEVSPVRSQAKALRARADHAVDGAMSEPQVPGHGAVGVPQEDRQPEEAEHRPESIGLPMRHVNEDRVHALAPRESPGGAHRRCAPPDRARATGAGHSLHRDVAGQRAISRALREHGHSIRAAGQLAHHARLPGQHGGAIVHLVVDDQEPHPRPFAQNAVVTTDCTQPAAAHASRAARANRAGCPSRDDRACAMGMGRRTKTQTTYSHLAMSPSTGA